MLARVMGLFLSVYIPFFIPAEAIVSGGSTAGGTKYLAFDGTSSTSFVSSQTGAGISGVAYIGVLYPFNEAMLSGPFYIIVDQCGGSGAITAVKYQIHTSLGWSSGTSVSVGSGVTAFTANLTGEYDGLRLMADANLGGSARWTVCELGLYMKQPDPGGVAQEDTPTPTITPTASNTPSPTPDYYVGITSTAGSPMAISRTATFGEMAISGSVCILAAVLFAAFSVYFWRRR